MEDKLENLPQDEKGNDKEMKTTRERKITMQKQEQRSNIEIINIPEFLKN